MRVRWRGSRSADEGSSDKPASKRQRPVARPPTENVDPDGSWSEQPLEPIAPLPAWREEIVVNAPPAAPETERTAEPEPPSESRGYEPAIEPEREPPIEEPYEPPPAARLDEPAQSELPRYEPPPYEPAPQEPAPHEPPPYEPPPYEPPPYEPRPYESFRAIEERRARARATPGDDLRRASHRRERERPSAPPALRAFASRAGFVLWLAFLVFGLAVTPRTVGELVQRDEMPEARVTRERIGQRLASLRDRFVLLAEDVDQERRRVEKVRVAYGLATSARRLPESPVDPKSFPNSVFLPLIEETATLATRARIEVVELEASVAALRAFEGASPDTVATTPGLAPLMGDFVMTSPVGQRKSTFTEEHEYHSGVDLAAAVGTPVLAPADGRVVFAGKFPVSRDSTWWRLGSVVAVRHGDDLLTLYGHLGRILVRPGQNVTRGDQLSEIGESGVIAHPHLHYAVWRRVAGGAFEPTDPRIFMLDRQWDDESDLLAKAGERARPGEYEPLPRQLIR